MALHEHIGRAIHKLSEAHKEATGKKSKTFKNKEGEKKEHVGFKGAQNEVEREGYSKKIAGAIIASRSRHASKGEKEKNPRLKRVLG
jgi:hypothetical protein